MRKEEIDLHGVKHKNVISVLENTFFWENVKACKIITGNSDKMKKIVTDWLVDHDYNFFILSSNIGVIEVL